VNQRAACPLPGGRLCIACVLTPFIPDVIDVLPLQVS
jgi:hypothetical protein